MRTGICARESALIINQRYVNQSKLCPVEEIISRRVCVIRFLSKRVILSTGKDKQVKIKDAFS